ncbi:adenylyl cyclase-associated protein 1-like [Halichondria panicea]|uniref:adenylyl cyclase-associated protein 1-like n=1 Tax=Halichondria panicea TaxID=6063 RepID=UPI00312B8F0E
MSGDLASLVSRLETVTTRLESVAASGGGGTTPPAAGTSESVEAFDVVLNGKIKTFFELSKSFEGEVAEQSKLVEEAYQLVRGILVLASQHKQPAKDVLSTLMKPLADKVQEVVTYAEKRRSSKVFNQLMTVKEGIGCVGWVSVSPKPAPYVKEMGDQALFYGNRVIKEFKGKDEKRVEWVRAFTGSFAELQTYVKDNHTTGLVWNKQGSVCAGGAPPPPASAGPPPPPPPAVLPPTDAPKPSGDAAAKANLFASLNKGADVTKGLKKVSKDQMTHKNPALRVSSVVKEGEIKKTTSSAPKAMATTVKKPPVCQLQNKKWVVEYQDNNPSLTISETNAKQSVYVFRCTKTTIKVTGKVNSIILDNCKRVALCFDDVISSCEVINSSSVQVQILGKCRTVSIDKTDGCQVFLNKDCLDCDIFSAKSSEMNICIPKGSDDYSEFALAEQFKSKWNGKTFVTECSDV